MLAHRSATVQGARPTLTPPSRAADLIALKVLRAPNRCVALVLEVFFHRSHGPFRWAWWVPLYPRPRQHRCSDQRVLSVAHRTRTGQGSLRIPQQTAFKPFTSQLRPKSWGKRQLWRSIELTNHRAPPPRTHTPVTLAATHIKNRSDQNTVTPFPNAILRYWFGSCFGSWLGSRHHF
jgi:hypothetical protein